MHLELVSLLRCPVDHADGWLVAAVDRATDRVIVEGTLGCPVCGADYAIRGGITYLTGTSDEGEGGAMYQYTVDAVRLAAMLDATDPSHTIALVAHDVADADALQRLTSVRCLVINPPKARATASGVAPSGVIVTASVIPLAPAQLHAISLGPGAAHLTELAATRLRPGGRLLAPVRAVVPAGLRVLARDASHWVAEQAASPSAPVPLVRRTQA